MDFKSFCLIICGENAQTIVADICISQQVPGLLKLIKVLQLK